MRSRRDATVVVTLAYFLLLTHFLYAQDIPAGLGLPVALSLLTAALIRLHGGAAAGGPRRVLGQAALLCVQSLPFMLVLFVLFPRVSGPLWGLPQDAHAGLTGLSETMTPGSIADLVQNGELAFSVRFDGAIRRATSVWRGPVEHYDGDLRRSRPARASGEVAPAATRRHWNARLTCCCAHARPRCRRFRGRRSLTAKSCSVSSAGASGRGHLDYATSDESRQLRRNRRGGGLPPGRNPQARALAKGGGRRKRPDGVIRRALALSQPRFAYTLNRRCSASSDRRFPVPPARFLRTYAPPSTC
jgi:hypothetical protein